MGSLVYVELLNNPRYRRFLRQALPWILPLISRNLDRLMFKLQEFTISLLQFAKPEMKITDSERGEAYIEQKQFIGDLNVVHQNYLPGEQHFDYIVHVRLVICRRRNAVPILKQ